MENEYSVLIEAMIKHQESVIGPLAWNEASKVSGLKISARNVSIDGSGKTALEKLVNQYKNIFGQASVEACKDAVRPLLPKMKNLELPSILL